MGNTSNNNPVIAFGELLWDLLPSGSALGGAPANFSFRLSTLGLPVLLISRVGRDKFGEEACRILAAAGLDVSGIQHEPKLATGTVDVSLSRTGAPRFVINKNVAYDEIACEDQLLKQAERSPLIYFGTLAQRAPTARNTLYSLLDAAPQAVKFLDINLRKECYSGETVTQSLKRADILKLNDDEVEILSELFALRVASVAAFCRSAMDRFNLKVCIVTLGDKGVFALSKDGQETYLPGYVVNVVDTVGSGDSFSAGFVASYLRGCRLDECCHAGNTLGALVASRRGAMAPVSEDEIKAFPAGSSKRLVHPEFLGLN